MFKPIKKQLIYSAVFVFLLIFLFSSTFTLRQFLTNTLKHPLILIALIQREATGIVFYHRNFVENEALKREVDFLRQKVNSLNEFHLENMRLKDNLSFKAKSGLKLVAARVIARAADSWSSIIIIDKGNYQGIRRGMSVITYLGLVGRIVETTNSTSKVMLLSDPNLGVSSLIQRSRQEGLVSGTLGSNLIMKYLPESADLKLEDIVVSSGLNDTYPKGLLIGKVVEIGKEFSDLSRYAIIKPSVNLSNIEEVLVVIP